MIYNTPWCNFDKLQCMFLIIYSQAESTCVYIQTSQYYTYMFNRHDTQTNYQFINIKTSFNNNTWDLINKRTDSNKRYQTDQHKPKQE